MASNGILLADGRVTGDGIESLFLGAHTVCLTVALHLCTSYHALLPTLHRSAIKTVQHH